MPFWLSVSGLGNAPLTMLNAYRPEPPVAARARAYGAPTAPAGSGQTVAIVGVTIAAFTVKEQLFMPICGRLAVLSATWTLNVEAPATVGVPETKPVVDSVNPVGKLPSVIE